MFIYYVYAYLREDGTPYYIGKGKGRRAYSSRHTVKVPKDQNRIVFLEKNLSEIGAYALEKRYIEWYGRKIDSSGILRNLTEGGFGVSLPGEKNGMWGREHSNEARKKISDANRGRPNPHLIALNLSRTGQSRSEETKRKISETKKQRSVKPWLGKRWSDEQRAELAKRKWWNDGISEKFSEFPPSSSFVRGRLKKINVLSSMNS